MVHYILSCYHGNTVTKGNFFNNSVIYKNVELKFSMDTYSGPLISESNINPIPHGIFCITCTLGEGWVPVPYKLVISKDIDL